MKTLSVSVDDFFVDIYFHFDQTVKRRETLKEFQAYTKVEHMQVLKHCQTHWLSILRIVQRVLIQYPALVVYFINHDGLETAGKVKHAMQRLKDPLTKLTLIFLNFILPVMNDFNKLFQANETGISYLLPERTSLLCMLAVKFVQMKHVKSKADVREVKFELAENQYDNELLVVGVPVRTLLANTDNTFQKGVQVNFFGDVRKFYCAVVRKMVKLFPFDDRVINEPNRIN